MIVLRRKTKEDKIIILGQVVREDVSEEVELKTINYLTCSSG